jgi:hypothetical protein
MDDGEKISKYKDFKSQGIPGSASWQIFIQYKTMAAEHQQGL